MKPGFYVHASNIHSDQSETYGAFPGLPGMTYEFLRCDGTDNVPDDDHIFSYSDDRDRDRLNGRRDVWIDQEGNERTDGWRRCYATDGQFGIEHGPFWTDLWITTERFNVDPRWESNRLPQETP